MEGAERTGKILLDSEEMMQSKRLQSPKKGSNGGTITKMKGMLLVTCGS